MVLLVKLLKRCLQSAHFGHGRMLHNRPNISFKADGFAAA